MPYFRVDFLDSWRERRNTREALGENKEKERERAPDVRQRLPHNEIQGYSPLSNSFPSDLSASAAAMVSVLGR